MPPPTLRAIDLGNWTFQSPPLESPVDLALHVAELTQGGITAVENRVNERLQASAAVKVVKQRRTLAKDLTHFPRYRRDAWYQRYHDAALAEAAQCASADQSRLAEGLQDEIIASRVILPAGQVLFHGRADRQIETSPYPTFISTSLSPTVARWHALKRKHKAGPNARALVYALTLARPFPAIWGHYGKSHEWELLLQRSLTVFPLKVHQGTHLDIVEAEVLL